jgi:hypothetical protein
VLPDVVEDEPELELEPMFGHLCVVEDDGAFVAASGLELAAAVTGRLAVAAWLVAFMVLVAATVFVAAWVEVCVARLGCAPATAAPMPTLVPTRARPATAAPIACLRIVISLPAGTPSAGTEVV